MFKKRLKGLLAMLLAGSIAATALPLTASATISDKYVDVCEVNRYNPKQVPYYELQKDESVSPYLNENNLWGVYYSYSYYDSGYTPAEELSATGTEAFSGDKLLEKIEGFEDDYRNFYSDIRITAQHKYIVTTDDPSAAELSGKSALTTSTFPVEIPLTNYDFANPLMDYSCTPWYGITNAYGNIYPKYAVKSTDEPVRFSAGDESISIGMDTFKGLYSADIHTGNQNDAIEIFLNGITILQLKSEYKTLSLPVKNAFLKQEKDSSGADRYISVSKDSESLLDEENYYFYLCYYDEEQQSFKISSSEMKTEKAVWNVINSWVTADPTLDTNNLFLCRSVAVNVNGNGVDSTFYTTDLLDYLIVNQGEDTTNVALRALLNAKPNSIWEVNPRFTENPRFYIYQKDAATSISDFLLEYPHEKRLNLFEQSSIRVTALDPNTNGEIEWGYFIESKLLDDNGEPRKISDHFNDLFGAVPQEAGKKYDADGWQLWAGVTSCGGLYDFSKVELDKKPDSIGVTELNKRQNSIAFVYFPQVEIAPSLEVTAPVAGETPSTECKILDKLGGYSVDGVEWDCDYTLLVANDKFEAGKKYRVKIDLLPDGNLSFVDSTPVTINGKEAFETILDDAYFSVYQVFTTAPEKPVNVKATAGDGKVDLTWESGKGAYGYNVYFYNKDGTLTEIARTQNNSCTVEKLENGTEYGFLVRSVSTYGDESSYTAEDVVYATPVAPATSKPENVKATAGDGQVTVSWDAVPGATKYAVYYSKDGSSYTLASTSVTAASYTVTGLANGTKYFFKVKAAKDGTWSEMSDAVLATPVAAISVPTNLKATAGNGQVTVSWTASAGATKYAVYYSEDGSSYTLASANVTETSYTFTGLTNGTKYFFKVKAAGNGVWSGLSNYVTATPVGAISAPTNLKATAGNGQVTVSWTAPAGATKYAVYYSKDASAYTLASANVTETSYTFTGLTNGTKYFFKVKAAGNGVWSGLSNYVTATPVAAISAPTNLKATAGNGQVIVSWTAPVGATKYAVYYSKDASTYTLASANVTETSYTFTGLTNGTKYFFKVKAAGNGVWSGLSNYVTATPVGTISAPTNLKATAGNGQVTVSWTAPVGATKYAVYYSKDASTYTLASANVTETSYTFTGLTNGTKYFFKVKAAGNGVWSGLSNYVTATPVEG